MVGAGLVELWRIRARSAWGGIALGAVIAGSAVWAYALLARTPDFATGLGIAILAVGAIVAVILAVPARHAPPRTAAIAGVLGLAILLAGPAAYALDTVGTAYAGGDPSAGPSAPGVGGFGRGGGQPGGGFAGGPGGGTSIDDALTSYLAANRGDATWIVAVSGANDAGSIELATGLPVMAMGGFSGSDLAPTLEQLQAYVASGQLRYVLVGGRGGPGGGASSDVSSWVAAHGTLVESVGNGSLYDLSSLATGS